MITQYDGNSLLREEIPQLSGKVYPSRVSLQVYASMNYFSDYKSTQWKNIILMRPKNVLPWQSVYSHGDNHGENAY